MPPGSAAVDLLAQGGDVRGGRGRGRALDGAVAGDDGEADGGQLGAAAALAALLAATTGLRKSRFMSSTSSQACL